MTGKLVARFRCNFTCECIFLDCISWIKWAYLTLRA